MTAAGCYHSRMTDPATPPDDDLGDFTDAELKALATSARERGDDATRRLVSRYITLRRLTSDMLTFIEAREGAVTVVRTPIFQRLRELTRLARG